MFKRLEEIVGLSVKTMLVTLLGILLFGVYVGILIDGENSLTVLHQLKKNKRELIYEARKLNKENQKLQKSYFELKQLEPKE